MKLTRRLTIYVYLNPDNDFFLCPVSFLLPCVPPIPNKSAHIYKDFFFFFSSPFFFFISPITSFLSLSLPLPSSTKANNRKNGRARDDEFANTSHYTYTKILFFALFLFLMLAWREHNT